MSYVKELYSQLMSGKVALITHAHSSGKTDHEAIRGEQRNQLLALKKAVMFKLPVDGVIIDDDEHKAITRTEDLHFPFGTMTLEFKNNDSIYTKVIILIDDTLVVAADTSQYDAVLAKKLEDRKYVAELRPLIITSWVYSPKRHCWGQYPAMIMPTRNWSQDNQEGDLAISIAPLTPDAGGEKFFEESTDPIVTCVMGFLNASNCSNVEAHPIKPHRVGTKPPLPFDDYYTLSLGKVRAKGEAKTIQGLDRHGPREHLRRGHIRRLTHLDGRRIWINASVINAGAPGSIYKDYKMEQQ